MLQNAYLLAKIGADTAENEQHFAENVEHSPRPPPPAHRLGGASRAPECSGDALFAVRRGRDDGRGILRCLELASLDTQF